MSSSLQSLKASLLQDQSIEERVEVNQRHLIDKILARYSAENTIFRELLQNSNDAGATEAQIHFKTSEKLLKASSSSFLDIFIKRSNPTVTEVVYKNNGRPFSGDDWNRLKKIAEGNPDEQKIGFFGVGFYSLFSICEEPFVSSGSECLAFFWKGDQLFTKKGKVDDANTSPLTSFYLGLREPIETPNVVEFGRFLAASIAFTRSLKKVEVFIDDDRVLCLEKSIGESRPLTFARGLYNLQSPNQIFDLRSINVSKNQLKVFALVDYDKSKGKSGNAIDETVQLRIAVGSCNVKLSSQLCKEMERTTKKRPPATTELFMLFTNFDEYECSVSALSKSAIFSNLIIPPKDQGKIFIGFPTHQTTGASFQLAAHLIPTVERESIDFVDRTLNVWNQDILAIGGVLSRIVFEDEMASIGNLFKELTLDDESRKWLRNKADHALSSFTFRMSTPAMIVGKIHKSYFFKGGRNAISMISTKGILPLNEVRIPDQTASGFVREVPTIPSETLKSCEELITDLEALGLLKKFDLEDLYVELSKRVLEPTEVVALVKWWLEFRRNNPVSNQEISKLFQLLVVVDPQDDANAPARRLIDLKHYVNPQIIPPNVPIPKTCLPLSISKHFSKSDLGNAFPFLSELTLPEWTNFVLLHPDFKNPAFVEQILSVISRQFGSMSASFKESITLALGQSACIVTSKGMKRPTESYLKTVTLFEDLPIVSFEAAKHFPDSFLKSLGVRDHVDLQLIFSRLQDLKWDSDHMLLDKLTSTEMGRLKLTPIFPKEEPSDTKEDEKEKPAPKARYKASDLYAPSETLRILGLPLISWPSKTKWRATSDEGLQSTIPISALLDLCAKSLPEKRMQFFEYFAENFKSTYSTVYGPANVKIPFIPSSNRIGIFRPVEIYSDPGADILDFTSSDWRALHLLKFIPIEKKDGSKTFWAEPGKVYFGSKESSVYGDQFLYIDFGETSNAFLRACGVKDEPSPAELTLQLIQSPKTFLDQFGFEKYLQFLRTIASNYAVIRQQSELYRLMKDAPFLIGIRSTEGEKDLESEKGKEHAAEYELARARDIYLIDDPVLNLLFIPLGAPMEAFLEDMYADLGSKWLSTQVTETTKPEGQAMSSKRTQELQELIHERSLLLLYDGLQMRAGKDIAKDAENILKSMQVVEVPRILTERTFIGMKKSQRTSSCLMMDKRSNKFYLFITVQEGEVDYFDVAQALGKVIFKKCRLNDALLLSTLLSTSLLNLKRKGFPVDRLLNLQESKLKEAKMKAAQNFTASSTPSTSTTPPPVTSSPIPAPAQSTAVAPNGVESSLLLMFPDISRDYLRKLLAENSGKQDVLDIISNKLLDDKYPKESPNRIPNASKDQTPSAISTPGGWPEAQTPPKSGNDEDLFGRLNKLAGTVRNNWIPDLFSSPTKQGTQTQAVSTPGAQAENSNPSEITPQHTEHLKKQLSMAVSSVKESKDASFRARIPFEPDPPPARYVAVACKTLSDSDLALRGSVDGVPLYIERAAGADGEAAVANSDALQKFSRLLKFLARVFNLAPTAVNIYFDKVGSTVAFNRDRTLFFNLRFYLGLHHKQGVADSADTYYYWFMTMCHELAHNFVAEHNSHHEYYFSSFAENYLHTLHAEMSTARLI
ncbi:hypothetical protein HDU97_003420 [Phlyctochytrium planicorne]|nr:hypothetical protein HDU97_003420 [Phlyctochytrium planicorne]